MNADNRRPLRILHTEASTGWGGQEIRILDESAGLRARGHDVRIAAVGGAPIIEAADKRGIPFFEIPIDHRNLSALLALKRVVTQFKPDVIVTHSSTDSWLTALLFGFRRRRPGIVRVRHLGAQIASGTLNRWLYGRVPDHVVTTGEATRSMIVNTLGLDPSHLTSVPTGIDPARFRPGDRADARTKTGLADAGFIIGIVATLRSGKGIRFLLPVLQAPGLHDATLAVVGDGPQEQALRAQAAELGIADRVVFAGRQQDVVPWLQSFDVFALPSIAIEGAPQAVMQAMAAGVPVVATPVGAIPELVEDGKTGVFVPVGDTEAMAHAFERLKADPAMRQGLADAARRFAEANCTIAVMIDLMEDILRKTAQRHP
ncbi:MAG: glycosyltransferase family 4 protein [Bradyrhizobiaceae bacterium]|nr:glycosyltransferase family 4 protein [Bradyrhizobiaceae bacterium]